MQTIGIIGAGKLGITLAQLAHRAGHKVSLSSSGAPRRIQLIVDTLVPGATATTTSQAIQSDIVILALPLGKFRQLQPEDFASKLVIDAMNYWWEVDGPRSEILPDDQSSSEAVQEFLPGSRVVKAFSHMGYHDLHDEAKPAGQPGRKAIALAGNNADDLAAVSTLIDTLGFDPLSIGLLAAGRQLEPGRPAFGANLSHKALQELLQK